MSITDAPQCQHRHADGTRCQRPARRRLRLCNFHHREYKRAARKLAERARQRWFESVALDDPNSIQRALAQVMHRLLLGEIDPHRAGQLLNTLQMASTRLRAASSRTPAPSPAGGGISLKKISKVRRSILSPADSCIQDGFGF